MSDQVTTDPIMEGKSYIRGLKSHRISSFLKITALHVGVEIKITDVDQGWFRETVSYTVIGNRADIESFGEVVKTALKEHGS